ncbi:tryptophan--tRNA ligase [Inhella gelatinilytica]|uniref:Tryptophan--tRNA ligase n=1 Tax=Inhella gelatinilytica TaxID=2795030 RepID=A0A931J168_9BURK|nr:tryptophan--tRNA ligase [Inhella gelatinilytica]MBH9553628.1 tryptophan--tRNA ligase [Inhella gelatinilytica]
MTPTRVLTGITTTGTLHLGNYVGAIRPAIAASREPGVESFFFMADYHGLIKCDDPDRVEASRLQIAATWIAAGLDTDVALLYRQSDVPEVCELTWLLTCITAKGQMNRAHAYKAAVDASVAAGEEPDSNVTMGLYCYPILMAADILLYNAHRIPVGKDQVQHIEMARDVAQRFNHLYGDDFFVLPEAQVDAEMELLPGLDGRKMSKSYDNVVPLFEGGLEALKAAIAKIVTDSREPGEPKEPEGTPLIQLWDAFSTREERAALRSELRAGLGWGAAKQRLVAQIDRELGPMRARYEHLMTHPDEIEAILLQGAERARAIARPLLARLREAVGLRRSRLLPGRQTLAPKAAALPVPKQYRESDGLFYVKLVQGDQLLLLSPGFAQGKEAGQWWAQVKREGRVAATAAQQVHDRLDEALAQLRAAEADKKASQAAAD